MRIPQLIVVIIIFLTTTTIISQGKLKGNKIITSENRAISDFTKIEVIDDLNVILVYNDDQSVTVEADSNLQSTILTSVKNGILTIRTEEVIGRSKLLNVHLKINKNITEINTYNHATVNSNNSLIIDNLTINAYDSSEINLKLNTKDITIIGKSSSKLNFEILSTNTTIKLEGYSQIKGSINTKTIAFNLLDKSAITLNGIANDLALESYGSTSFKGKDFTTKTATIKANNDATIFINSTEKINLYSNNNTEINIYANPEIIVHEFYDKAMLRKKEFN
jgi:hypothetical protein